MSRPKKALSLSDTADFHDMTINFHDSMEEWEDRSFKGFTKDVPKDIDREEVQSKGEELVEEVAKAKKTIEGLSKVNIEESDEIKAIKERFTEAQKKKKLVLHKAKRPSKGYNSIWDFDSDSDSGVPSDTFEISLDKPQEIPEKALAEDDFIDTSSINTYLEEAVLKNDSHLAVTDFPSVNNYSYTVIDSNDQVLCKSKSDSTDTLSKVNNGTAYIKSKTIV